MTLSLVEGQYETMCVWQPNAYAYH